MPSNKKACYSIVLPVYNEEKNVWLIAKEYAKINDLCPIEILFVEDGGSSDNTRIELQKIAKEYPFVKNVFTSEPGYGISIFNGLKNATSNYIGWTHSDLQTDPRDTLKAYRRIAKNSDNKKIFIKGQRYGRPLFDRFFTTGMSIFESFFLGTMLWDINAQPNMFHRSFLDMIPNPPHDFSFDLYCYYIAKQNGYEIKKFPVDFKARIHGESHWNTGFSAKFKFIKRTLDFSLKMKKMID